MGHIGKAIKEELERQERSVAWFARQLSCDRSNVYRIFQKKVLIHICLLEYVSF